MSTTKGKVFLSSWSITGLVGLSYFGLYTGYDKATKRLSLKQITDFVYVERGWDWTLTESNKFLSLTGLTCTLLSFLPQFAEQSRELLFQSMTILWTHSVYSFYKFYGNSLRKLMKDNWIKQFSISMGVMGQLALSAGYWGQISNTALVTSATVLGVGHFYTYELDYHTGELKVRPYAFLPFPLAAGVLLYHADQIRNWIGKLASR